MIARPNSKAVDRKARLAYPEEPPPIRPASERARDFGEVQGDWDLAGARTAAARCIQCPAAPCVKACPLGNDIPWALWLLEHGDVGGAAAVFRSTSPMPGICGRVCPQSELCEGACPYTKQGRAPVPIGRLEAFVCDEIERPLRRRGPSTGHRAAIVGGGPAGLAVAETLAALGHAVTVFDAWPAAGGLLRYGIPGFKMSQDRVRELEARLGALGVRFIPDTRIGRDRTVDDLLDGEFETVFLGIGAGIHREASIEGTDLPGIFRSTPFLVRANVDAGLLPPDLGLTPDVGRKVAVIGGGDTAMDCARTAIRLGAEEVTCYYRRTEAEMPGNPRDRQMAREEGVHFEWLTRPVRFRSRPDGSVGFMECARNGLGEADASGRRRPVPVEGSEHAVEVDTVILALGYVPDAEALRKVSDLEIDDSGRITVDPETGSTRREGLYAGGDAVSGPALVVTALAQARRAAEAMHLHMIARPTAPPGKGFR